ncbi:MAG: 2-amino-4-oxopentanoate thiolase subunit OrtA [Firmicutes bacterium]|jgi:hypothetical protein|nr:2-amino-4-oxopentanoate thiolase subunit OrtA [Bacillota bacterium]
MIKKGSWVRIHRVILKEGERAPQLPDDTLSVPLEMWVKGYLTGEGELGEIVEVVTLTGRKVEGRLVELEPSYRHDYGDFIPEILQIGKDARKILFGGDTYE